MDASVLDEFAAGLGPILAKHCTAVVNDAVAPLLARIAELEGGLRPLIDASVTAAVATLPPAPAGKSVTVDDVRPLLAEMVAALPVPENGKDSDPELIRLLVAETVAALPLAKNGKDADPADVARMVTAEVERTVAALPRPENGKDADPEVMAEVIAAEVGKAVAALPPAPAGKDADPAIIRAMVAEAVADIPKPENGKSVTVDELRPIVVEAVAVELAKVPPAPAGKSVTMEDVRPLLVEMVAALPVPENGKSVTVDDVRPLIADAVGKAISALPVVKDGKDGIGLAGALIGRDGELILTLTDGSTKELGIVVGRDADPAALTRQIEEAVAKFPKPKDGKDAFALEDIGVRTEDDGRTIVLEFLRDDAPIVARSLTTAVVLDRGVYKPGKYCKGDGVTFGGSFFIAQKDTDTRPETGPDWRLAVKRGRDGKDGKPGDKGEPGKEGPRGRDLTQMGFDGSKHG